MVFGMISFAGTAQLVRLPGRIYATAYKEIFKKYVVINLRTAISPNPTAKCVKKFLFEEDVTVMEWSDQSPDMNLFESVWKLLNKRTKEKKQETLKNYGLI